MGKARRLPWSCAKSSTWVSPRTNTLAYFERIIVAKKIKKTGFKHCVQVQLANQDQNICMR